MGNKKYQDNKNNNNVIPTSHKKGLDFGFLGVGQCGGNIANAYAGLGYKAIAVNTAETDLKKLDNIPIEHRLLISLGNIQGAGKDPNIGKAAVAEHYSQLMELIDQVFNPRPDILYVCGGFGGGTGTGIVPALVKLFEMSGFDTKIGVICTLPADMESPKSKLVASTGFSELSEVTSLGALFIIDNNKLSSEKNDGFKTQYISSNKKFAAMLNNINECCALASEVSFDPRDFHTMLLSRGELSILRIKFDDMNKMEDTYIQKLNDAIKTSMFSDTDMKKGKGISLVFETPKNGGNAITKKLIGDLYKFFNDPFEQNLGIYENRTMGREVILNIVISGLPFPYERLKVMEKAVEEKGDTIKSIIESGQTQTYKSSSADLLNQLKGSVTTQTNKSVSPQNNNSINSFLEAMKLNMKN